MATLPQFSAKLSILSGRIRSMGRVPALVSSAAAKVIEEDMRQTYAAEQNPYGTAWAQRVREPKDGHPILFDTGKLEGSRKVTVSKNVIFTKYTDYKSVFHQSGTKNMKQRLMLPTVARGLPARWKKAIASMFKKSLNDIWQGK